MNKEKQIEEMRKIICESIDRVDKLPEVLTAKGYRKADEFAREIFEEIHRRFKELYEEGKMAPFQCCVKAINETETKYTKSEKDE